MGEPTTPRQQQLARWGSLSEPAIIAKDSVHIALVLSIPRALLAADIRAPLPEQLCQRLRAEVGQMHCNSHQAV